VDLVERVGMSNTGDSTISQNAEVLPEAKEKEERRTS
jgi:hypothetical protein